MNCKTCLQEKPVEDFYVRADNGKLRPDCRICQYAIVVRWKNNNKERNRYLSRISHSRVKDSLNERRRKAYTYLREIYAIRHKKYNDCHKEQRASSNKLWRDKNAERIKIVAKRWYLLNPAKRREAVRRRDFSRISATPSWANRRAIVDIYNRAIELGLHVDHIVPLKHDLVCGLHVEWNLQLLTTKENRQKHNKWPWP